MKTVAVIHTGGTIQGSEAGSRQEKLTVLEEGEQTHKVFTDLKSRFRFLHIKPYSILSENAKPEHWLELKKSLEATEKNLSPDAYLILHGTDTMTYSTAALAFLSDLWERKAIIFTGASDAPNNKKSDARENIAGSLQMLDHLDHGLFLYFRGSLFSATRTRKDLREETKFHEFPEGNNPIGLSRHQEEGGDPVWLRPAPGLDIRIPTGATLLEMYPSWTAPRGWLEKLIESPYPLFLVAGHGFLPETTYPSLAKLREKGMILPMLPETAWVKMLCFHHFQKERDWNEWMKRRKADEFLRRLER